jgi:hypothetical protein
VKVVGRFCHHGRRMASRRFIPTMRAARRPPMPAARTWPLTARGLVESPSIRAPRQISAVRVAVVSAGLIAGGALAGAAAGALGATIWLVVTEGVRAALDPNVWFVAGVVGAPLGAILLPLAGFTALRRVPLGRLLASTVAATAVGGALGAIATPEGWVGGAIAGFLLATGWLWHRSRGPRRPGSDQALGG